jgi:hypothetical protein
LEDEARVRLDPERRLELAEPRLDELRLLPLPRALEDDDLERLADEREREREPEPDEDEVRFFTLPSWISPRQEPDSSSSIST